MNRTIFSILTGLFLTLNIRSVAAPSAAAPGEAHLAALVKSTPAATFRALVAVEPHRRDGPVLGSADTHDAEAQVVPPVHDEAAGKPGAARRSIAKAGNSRTRGTKSVLFIRVNFPDSLEEPISVSDAEALMEGADEFFGRNSYGALSLKATVTPLLILPQPKTWYAAQSDDFLPLKDARAAAERAGYWTATYDLDCMFSASIPGKPRGLGYIGGKGVLLHLNDVGVACHEFGHNLGLVHADAWHEAAPGQPGTGAVVEYGNPFDTMGRGWGEQWDFNAFEKHLLGWLPTDAVQQVSSNGLYRLEPSDAADLVDGAKYALRFKKDGTRDYWVETRRRLNGSSNPSVLAYQTAAAGANFTRLLDATPETSTFGDAPFLAGQAMFDAELGLKLLPWPSADSDTSAVDVFVQTLHQLVIEAEAGELASVLRVDAEALASQGRCLTSVQSRPGTANYQAKVPATGHYALWARVGGPAGHGGIVYVFVDGQRQGSLRVSAAELPETWRWMRADGLNAETHPLLAPVPLFLIAGEHQVSLGFYGAALQLDCLMLSTDPTQNSLPMISPFGPQTVVGGQTLGPLPFSVLDLESPPSALTVSATVGNTDLVPTANIRFAGAGPNWSLMLTAPTEQSGATTVTLTAHDSDGNVRSTSFPVTVVGVLRSRIEAANTGDTVVMPAGTFFDNLTLSKDLTIEAEQTGATVIDGKGLGSPFTITDNATVHLRGLVIRNGRGGGVKNFGTLRLSDCLITANLEKSGPYNGGVVNFGALAMERCVVSGNSAAYGAGVHNLGTLGLSECTIRDNVAGARGRGIYNQASGRLVLYRSALHSNRVSYGNGAGLYNVGELAAWTVTISGNFAKRKDDEGDGGLGGGVFNLGTALLESCTIADNQATVAAGGIANEQTLALRNSNRGTERPGRRHARRRTRSADFARFQPGANAPLLHLAGGDHRQPVGRGPDACAVGGLRRPHSHSHALGRQSRHRQRQQRWPVRGPARGAPGVG
ncbi:MAG: hypothetical protein HYY24_13220 [Verrucomicrobia bacterium]|nr:hypothetical protein [Verrucomicrobiota bacterium]